MRFWTVSGKASALVAVTLVGACGSNSDAGNASTAVDHLRCAAMISVADQLGRAGKVATDQESQSRALVASMTHLNAHSIPKGIGEKEAFQAVNAERDRLIGSLSPAQVMEQAKTCVAQTPTS